MLASSVLHEARKAGIATESLMIVGEVRRFEPAVRKVSLLGVAAAAHHQAIRKAFAKIPSASNVTLDLAEPENAGAAVVWHTGAPGHVEQLQYRAEGRGVRFTDARLTGAAGEPLVCTTEQQLYQQLAVPYLPPEVRHGEDEIERAIQGAFPELVTDVHIRGDLHMHSTWSDGRNTIEEMVLTAEGLGYEYVAITDHSPRAPCSHTLSVDDVPRQRDEIEALRKMTRRIRILHGVEVDILHDGTLDLADDVLEQFDIVLASLHDRAAHGAARLTERYLRAMDSPFVNVITHPANRSPVLSAGYDVDFDRLFAAAVATGTALEVDGAPGHLDLDGAIARRAADAGVPLVISSDCHRAESLARQMWFGVGTARRGWIEPRHVLNTGGVDEVRRFISTKRARMLS